MAGPDKVLCVDDDHLLLEMCRMMHKYLREMGRDFDLETAQDPQRALEMVAGQGPFTVVISDLEMPGMNGIQLLRAVKEIAPETVCCILTGAGSLQVAIDALNQGTVYRFLTKPCSFQTFDAAIEACREHYRLVRSEKELLEKTLTGSIEVVTGMLALANPTAFGRAARVRQRAKQLAQQLELANVWQIEIAAMLSQAGCIAMPEQVLARAYRGEELTLNEWRMYADHPRVAHDLTAHLPHLEPVARAIAYQEKHYDGAGIPQDALRGDDIPMAARVLKVAFDFETLHAKGVTPEVAQETMRARSGWYDPTVLAALEAVLRNDAELVLKEVSVKWLMEQLDHLKGMSGARILLAEDVVTTHDVLIVRKGHELTNLLLERLRNFSRHAVIREPIKVLLAEQQMTQGTIQTALAGHLDAK